MNNWTMQLKQVWCPSCDLNRHFKQKGIRYLPHTLLIPRFDRCAFSCQWSRLQYNKSQDIQKAVMQVLWKHLAI